MGTSKPKELFWVEMKLSGRVGIELPYRASAGVRGGKRSSLKACQDSRAIILRYDPKAQVRIFKAAVDWEEVK